MGDVLRAVHGEVFDPPALSDSKCPDELKRAWGKIQEATRSTADEINFQQLVEESGEKEKMYYI